MNYLRSNFKIVDDKNKNTISYESVKPRDVMDEDEGTDEYEGTDENEDDEDEDDEDDETNSESIVDDTTFWYKYLDEENNQLSRFFGDFIDTDKDCDWLDDLISQFKKLPKPRFKSTRVLKPENHQPSASINY